MRIRKEISGDFQKRVYHNMLKRANYQLVISIMSPCHDIHAVLMLYSYLFWILRVFISRRWPKLLHGDNSFIFLFQIAILAQFPIERRDEHIPPNSHRHWSSHHQHH